MRTVVWRVLALAVVAIAAGAAQAPPVIARVAWLQGCWELSEPNRIVEEQWMAPRADPTRGISLHARRLRGCP